LGPLFPGPYESGVASYKHLYFNATSAAAKIWFLVAGGAIALYECSARLLRLHSEKDRLRNPMVVLFCASVFSHYYAWWVCLNYYNDDFYVQWNHQMFFTVTELLSTAVVMNLADKQNPVTSRKVFIIVGVALLHILAGGADQFFNNVVRGEGYSHQVIRDLGFMIPDILHVIIPLMAYDKARKDMMITRTHWIRDNAVRKDLTLMVIGVATGFLICALL
ncbi:uncharacterized protein LOC113389750, partial [Ctenocephalides felis]|uniref:uncharacterized protein LOC113389750 n=1 Tax=Ctenocephalides felis TaxID=7515 RepID=UPI000E6E337B